MDWKEIISIAIFIIFLILVPALPGIMLWFFFNPITFWEKLSTFIVSVALYILVCEGLIAAWLAREGKI